jgi:hypothetical protein
VNAGQVLETLEINLNLDFIVTYDCKMFILQRWTFLDYLFIDIVEINLERRAELVAQGEYVSVPKHYIEWDNPKWALLHSGILVIFVFGYKGMTIIRHTQGKN